MYFGFVAPLNEPYDWMLVSCYIAACRDDLKLAH